MAIINSAHETRRSTRFSNCTKFTIIKMQTSEATQTEQNCGWWSTRFRGVSTHGLQITEQIFIGHSPCIDWYGRKEKGLQGLCQLFRAYQIITFNTGFLNPATVFICKNIVRFFKKCNLSINLGDLFLQQKPNPRWNPLFFLSCTCTWIPVSIERLVFY